MPIYNQTRQTLIAENVLVAKSFFARAKGLLGKKTLGPDEALVIPGCQAIHMVFMRFPIDVIFVDKKGLVAGLVPGIKPFCLSPIFFNAAFAIELKAGTIARTRTNKGDRLEMGSLDRV